MKTEWKEVEDNHKRLLAKNILFINQSNNNQELAFILVKFQWNQNKSHLKQDKCIRQKRKINKCKNLIDHQVPVENPNKIVHTANLKKIR
jgi:hypothetical protein